jgi:8-oxo-dGTP pyrophosphatase MutT (NUDIX family)
MTIEQPAPGEPRRPTGPRDPADAWVVADDGTRYWGRCGAAGLLAVDPDRGVLLQHRVSWSDHGDTWALPGGALHEGEAAVVGAAREANEEAGVPPEALRLRWMSILDLGIWSYSTVVADVSTPFEPVIGDAESHSLEWVPVGEVDGYRLHPGFAAAWPRLRESLATRPVVVVDAANVMGSVPDGWWKDRAGAATRLLGRIGTVATRGVAASRLDLPEDLWFPGFVVVVEGRARAASDPAVTPTEGAALSGGLLTIRAKGSGDDAIAAEAHRLAADGRHVTVVTSDRGLAARVDDVATVRPVSWLRPLLADG